MGKGLWKGTPSPTTPCLLTMNECSDKKVEIFIKLELEMRIEIEMVMRFC